MNLRVVEIKNSKFVKYEKEGINIDEYFRNDTSDTVDSSNKINNVIPPWSMSDEHIHIVKIFDRKILLMKIFSLKKMAKKIRLSKNMILRIL
jgi:hypothetical protein